MKRKVIIFALATAFVASSASAKPSEAWFFCKQFLGPQACSIFR